jgi:predicted NAD/FAD-binding protein
VLAGKTGDQPVDTGFIVFNFVNYPHLTRFFRDLDVPIERSDMSFGATIDDGRVEYSLSSLSALFGDKRNALRPAFLKMVRDILRFNAEAEDASGTHGETIDELLSRLNLGREFRNNYLIPMCGAIWSTPAHEIMGFPASTLIGFLRNHALMSARGQHQWWTVSGGSREYIDRAEKSLIERNVSIKTGLPVRAVVRDEFGVNIQFYGGHTEYFDQVIFACHPDEALRLLSNPTQHERAALGAIRFQDNHMVLHADEGQMPRRKSCWSSWVYQADTDKAGASVGVTYWMNRLQNIPEDDPMFVSLNPIKPINSALIYDEKTFRHPVFDVPAIEAQSKIAEIQGQNNTWFTGAWLRNGFHEDGFASAVRVARQLERQFV